MSAGDLQSADPRNPSVVRKFLMWWFGWPASPWVSTNLAIDAGAAQDYLDQLHTAGTEPRVSLQHLLAGALGRTLAEFPMARARIKGNQILHDERVGIAMPVNLLGHQEGARRELGMVVVEDADRLSLIEIARATRTVVNSERSGTVANPFFRRLLGLAERADGALLGKAFDALNRGLDTPRVDSWIHEQAPITTGLTNPGAALGEAEGMLFRGGAVSLPLRLVHVATFWGITPVQQEAVVRDGAVVARPMLPVMLVFDHRLMDGVYAGRVAKRFAEILQNPADTFGARGEQTR